jgi:transcriptional regulator with XRE-family HTH domain
MIKSLNRPALEDALPRAGLKQADIARELGVSREAVSKWFRGSSIPEPDKLLRLGMLLGLSFDELAVTEVKSAVPVVSFRRKGGRKTRDAHLMAERERGELLKRLVSYLPDQSLAEAPVLKEPRCEYDYVQKAAAQTRVEMEIKNDAKVEYGDLISKFSRLHAVIIPVLWGEQHYHGNALNIHLPDSGVTWIFLNLDSNAIDFKFWMSHELGHALVPKMGGDEGEDFADMFAQALLFPESSASALRSRLLRLRSVASRINAIKTIAKELLISPLTIRKAIESSEKAKSLEPISLGAMPTFMGATTNFGKGYRTMTQALFEKQPPKPKDYAAVGRSAFDSQFFEALSGFCSAKSGADHFIHEVLGLALSDSKALAEELIR